MRMFDKEVIPSEYDQFIMMLKPRQRNLVYEWIKRGYNFDCLTCSRFYEPKLYHSNSRKHEVRATSKSNNMVFRMIFIEKLGGLREEGNEEGEWLR